jgi:hypothetical protein
MKTVTLLINENDFFDYSFTSDTILFDELKKIMTRRIVKQAMLKCHQIAQKTGLANLTIDDINTEIKAVRENAKSRY